jgi:hypothetical protein
VGIKALALVDRHFNKWCSKGEWKRKLEKSQIKMGRGFSGTRIIGLGKGRYRLGTRY